MSSSTLQRPAPAPAAQVIPEDVVTPSRGGRDPYRWRRARRQLALHGVGALAWASLAMVLLVYFADRGTQGWATPAEAMKSVGILAGLVATDLMCLTTLLASRIPVLDRLLGHDQELRTHGGLGSWVVGATAAHGLLLTSSYAMSANTSFVSEFTRLWTVGDYVLAVVSFGLLLVVGLTSALLSVRKHLPHELWFGIHLATYVAIALSIPHQFTMDRMFDAWWAKALWVGLYAVTAFCLLAYRVVLPVLTSLSHRLVVSDVREVGAGLYSIEVTGRDLDQLGAQGGQFLSWRFWHPRLFWESHPFSLSAAPAGDRLRITVKTAGAGTRRLVDTLRPGVRVGIQGPYGIFTDQARTREAIVMVGSGSGIAPIRALLETTPTIPGRSLVVLRASHGDQVAHFEEFRALCLERGVQLVTLVGHRGSSWVPASAEGLTLVQLVPWIADADLYVCGPGAWADEVVAEAEAYGVHPSQVHRETFSF